MSKYLRSFSSATHQAIGREVPKKKVQSLWSRIINGMKKSGEIEDSFAETAVIPEQDLGAAAIKGLPDVWYF
jgi:hypothetical protein